MEYVCYLLIAALLAFGFWRVSAAVLYHDRYSGGRRSLRQIGKWYREKQDFWDNPLIQKLTNGLRKLVFLDDTARDALTRQLYRAGLDLTPEQYTARKYLVFLAAGLGILLCVLCKFWLGIIFCALIALYGAMRQREQLTSRIKARDEAIGMEMPRFTRTVCRTLRSNRDVYAALCSYRSVAGPMLGVELDILLSHMISGDSGAALQQFQKRIGTESAFRLCSALQEMERGIDQTTALDYLADDMARQAKLSIQKTLSTRPGKMRLTYLPAVGVCVAMIIYVLVVFIMNQLNNLF